jgi:DNA-binding NtrC family response regulator
MDATILVVDDEPNITTHLQRFLTRKGFEVAIAFNAKEARAEMNKRYPDVVLMDLRLPDANGAELMVSLKQDYPETRFIMMTAYGSIRSAVESTRLGAVDYLTKPFEPEELMLIIRNAVRTKLLKEEVERLRSNQRCDNGKERRISEYPSSLTRQMFESADIAASHDGIVLLLGESGVGKDYLARWIHQHSRRAEGPYFTINCAAVTRELAESELFGHEHGAFTGAKGRKRGMLELADGGTILLNEIGEMDIQLQSKLLSFLDTMSFIRVGGEHGIEIDTRIIAATNRDLRREVGEKRFREDLYYRLNVTTIDLPPLRERVADVPQLVDNIVARFQKEMRLTKPVIVTPDAMHALCSYHWPGNIRELRNALERAVITTRDGVITEEHLGLTPVSGDWSFQVRFPKQGESLHDVTNQAAKGLIQEALRRSKSKVHAAKMLGITRDALNYQMKNLGIS